jgi:hypothetical protein
MPHAAFEMGQNCEPISPILSPATLTNTVYKHVMLCVPLTPMLQLCLGKPYHATHGIMLIGHGLFDQETA